MPARPQSRPWRRIGAVAVIIAGLYLTMALGGHLTPKLGLDLKGGTSVILTPVKGSRVTTGALDQAVNIIRQRVDGLGVSGSNVVRQGQNVVISVPGKGRNSVLNLVGQTAALDFREVYQTGLGVSTPASTPPSTPAAASVHPSPAPTATHRPSAAPSHPATPQSSVSVAPAPLSRALLAAAPSAPAANSPGAVASPSPGASPSPAPAPPREFAGGTFTTPPPAAVAAFNALQCTPSNIRPINYIDHPTYWLASCDRTGTYKYLLKPADLVGTDVSNASATLQTTGPNGVITGTWIVLLDFKGSVQSKVESITTRLAGKNIGFAIVLDGVVESAPVIDSPFSASAQIEGSSASPFTQSQATDLANVLKYGALPLSFDPSQVLSISASLGRSSLQAGLVAGALGLALVLVYCFVYYRALGLVTIVSLSVSGLLVYATVTLLGQAIGFSLNLAGIAGLIVSIGITADSFVVFYERLKDEVREGRTVRSSVEKGWVRARRTILSADTVSFLAAVILYLVSIGDVRGFAFTLGISTLLDIFVVFMFTKPLVTLLVQRPFFSTSRASGLAPGHAGIPRRPRPGVGAPKEA